MPAVDREAQIVPALLFDHVEPEFEFVVMQRRPRATAIDAAEECEAGGRPHPHTSTLAAERRPSSRKGIDCRRHAAAGAKPCVRMGAPNPPPQVELYQPSPSPNDMQSNKLLRQRLIAVLERNDRRCLDNDAERQQVADDLLDMLDWYLADAGI